MTKIEEVARAIRAAQTGWDMPAHDWTYADLEAHGLIAEARAAIEAMREPTPGMIEAGAKKDAWCFMEGQEPQPDVYRAYIDAALKEGE